MKPRSASTPTPIRPPITVAAVATPWGSTAPSFCGRRQEGGGDGELRGRFPQHAQRWTGAEGKGTQKLRAAQQQPHQQLPAAAVTGAGICRQRQVGAAARSRGRSSAGYAANQTTASSQRGRAQGGAAALVCKQTNSRGPQGGRAFRRARPVCNTSKSKTGALARIGSRACNQLCTGAPHLAGLHIVAHKAVLGGIALRANVAGGQVLKGSGVAVDVAWGGRGRWGQVGHVPRLLKGRLLRRWNRAFRQPCPAGMELLITTKRRCLS